MLDELEAEGYFYPYLMFLIYAYVYHFLWLSHPLLYFIIFFLQIDAEPIFVYYPMIEEVSVKASAGIGMASTKGIVPEKEKSSVATDTRMKGFFDGVNVVTKAMASATVVSTKEIPI